MDNAGLIVKLREFENGAFDINVLMNSREMNEYLATLYNNTSSWARLMRFTSASEFTEMERAVSKILEKEKLSPNLRLILIELFELQSGVKLSNIKGSGETVTFERGIVVVPLGNDNMHSYRVGEPTLIYRRNSGIKPNGRGGDELTRTKQLLRVATREEIDSLIRSICSSSVSTLITVITEY